MSESWSKIRKILEQDRLCLKLQGRVRYYYTLYRKSHDQTALFEVKVDDDLDFDDPREELVEKLIEYQKFKKLTELSNNGLLGMNMKRNMRTWKRRRN